VAAQHRQQIVERAVAVEQHLRRIGDHHRHSQHRQDEQRIIERLAAERAIDQIGEQKTDDKAADRRPAGKDQRAHHCPTEARITEYLAEDIEPDEIRVPPGCEVDRPLMEREIELQQQCRREEAEQQQQERRQDHPLDAPHRAVARDASPARRRSALHAAGHDLRHPSDPFCFAPTRRGDPAPPPPPVTRSICRFST
jgi:hypothetical protein